MANGSGVFEETYSYDVEVFVYRVVENEEPTIC